MKIKKIEYTTTEEQQKMAKDIFGNDNPLSYLLSSNVTIGLDKSMQENVTDYLKKRFSKQNIPETKL